MILKYFDKFLSKLKTDRTTFVTYILTLLTIYFFIDRIVEMLFIAGSGLSVNYWGPLKYTFAFACATFAFYFSYASKFATGFKPRVGFLYAYIFVIYFLGISMLIQWVNQLSWYLLFCVPGYKYIITNFMELIKPAFSAFAWYVPAVTIFPLWKWIYMVVNDIKLIQDSIKDYTGISLGPSPDGLGAYTCENTLCRNMGTGKMLRIPETRRYESTAIVGVSGSGKTSMVFEPMIARDLEKKYFFQEASKEMGYTALRTGLALLDKPYSNDYLNENFRLDMLLPIAGKEKLYKAYMSKLIYYADGSKYIYKNLGITYLAPDYETLSHMIEIAKNYNIKYKIVDPDNQYSAGLNPFATTNKIKSSIAISSVIKRLIQSEQQSNNIVSVDETFSQTIVTQAVENLVILLQEMYPRLNNGEMPNLSDLLNMINNFDLVEDMVNKLEEDELLANEYQIQIGYFKKNFFKDAENRAAFAENLRTCSATLENLLRHPGVKQILCSRNNNILYDNALQDGEVIFVCTRRGDLGSSVHRAFGLFYLLLMQQSILSRPGIENSRIPHFLYIDEFAPFLCDTTEEMFTLYRKYRVGTMISAQNLAQLGQSTDESSHKETILSNCVTKAIFGGASPDDNEWWQKELGEHREWKMTNDYHTSKLAYDENYKGAVWAYKENQYRAKIQALPFKSLIFRTKDINGKWVCEVGKVDFLETKYKEQQKVKKFNFTKFTSGITTSEPEPKSSKFDLKNINFNPNPNNPNDMEPIQGNDSPYDYDNEDAIKPFNFNSNE